MTIWVGYLLTFFAMWIPNPKVASQSIATALNGIDCDLTFIFIRHPFDRLNSALNMLAPGKPKQAAYEEFYNNFHLRPQADRIDEMDGLIEFVGLYDRLNEDWEFVQDRLGAAPLPHIHKGIKDDFRQYDWSFAYDRYARDFNLCPLWS